MGLIYGVGRKKLKKYGNTFLSIISDGNLVYNHPIRRRMKGKLESQLYDNLMTAMRKQARGENGLAKPMFVSPSMIANIVKMRPRNFSDLEKIRGMNRRIMDRFGQTFLNVLGSAV